METVLPKFYQHISFSTTGDQTLDHCYIPSKHCYKLHPYPALQTTHHSSILLFSAYRQKPEQESLVSRNTFKWNIRKWSPRPDILPDWKSQSVTSTPPWDPGSSSVCHRRRPRLLDLEKGNTYVRKWKMSICRWISNFMKRTQVVRAGKCTSSLFMTNTGTLQDCALYS